MGGVVSAPCRGKKQKRSKKKEGGGKEVEQKTRNITTISTPSQVVTTKKTTNSPATSSGGSGSSSNGQEEKRFNTNTNTNGPTTNHRQEETKEEGGGQDDSNDDDAYYKRMHYAARVNVYLQALDREKEQQQQRRIMADKQTEKEHRRLRRQEMEDEKYQKMNYSIRMNFYLQALDRENEKKKRRTKKLEEDEQKVQDDDDLQLPPRPRPPPVSSPPPLKKDIINHTTDFPFKKVQRQLQRQLSFRPPLTLTELASSDPRHLQELHRNKQKADLGSFSPKAAWKQLKLALKFIPALKEEVEKHKIEIGVVSPELKAMILQGQMEVRPPPPPEFKEHYKPISEEAATIGLHLRLPEKCIEASGIRNVKEEEELKQAAIITPIWNPKQRVGLPIHVNRRSLGQQVTLEAAALGQIKRRKPQITYNYDPTIHEESELLLQQQPTNTNSKDDHRSTLDWWDPDEQVHYDRLEDVPLPTEELPLYQPFMRRTISHDDYAEGLRKGVQESAERRRKVRQQIQEMKNGKRVSLISTATNLNSNNTPEQLRMRDRCRCKYCPTSSPYQTNAYRRAWLIKQGMWKPGKLSAR